MNTCSSCTESVENNAEVCPYCGRNPYDGAGKVWWAIAALVILFWIFG